MKLLITLFTVLFSLNLFALSGGPDAYGYTWLDSNEPNGPTYNWIDITTVGTQITGLADDNSVSFINMGMDFHYYWQDYDQIKIGSNGWMSFDNVSNIAHCFPVVPTPGGAGDNFLAPFMSDLIFTGTGNPAAAYYYHDNVNDKFIISFIDVPWWSATAPGYVGSNTFQVILDNADSSIVFQYMNADAANFVNSGGCSTDLVIGIENLTGNIGLQCYQDAIPPSNYAIKFNYPSTVLLAVEDIKVNWHLNTKSQSEFDPAGVNNDFNVNIASVGNTDVTTDITVNVDVVHTASSSTVLSYQTVIVGGLNAGEDSTILVPWVGSIYGEHSITTTIVNNSDINPGNNTLISEIELSNETATGPVIYSYVNPTDIADGSISWSGTGVNGAAVHIVPNIYPFQIESIAGYMTGVQDNMTLELYLDDGPNGSAGTMLYTTTVPTLSVLLNTWNTVSLPTPEVINSGGVYVAWIQPGPSTLAVGSYSSGPESFRGHEILSGGWAEYRENDNREIMLRLSGYPLCGPMTAGIDSTENVTCFGESNGYISAYAFGGTPGVSGYTYDWTNVGLTGDVLTGIPAGDYYLEVTDSIGCVRMDTVTITEPTAISSSATTINETMGSDGSIDLTVSGGTPPYTFDWSNGSTSEDLSSLAGGLYQVIIWDDNGCSDTLDVTVNSELGIGENANELFVVYPNPSNGEITIKGSASGFVRVTDLTGRTIAESNLSEELKLTLPASGVYVVSVNTEFGTFTKQVVIQ